MGSFLSSGWQVGGEGSGLLISDDDGIFGGSLIVIVFNLNFLPLNYFIWLLIGFEFIFELVIFLCGRNMTKPVSFWYDRDESVFVPVTDGNSMMEVTRVPMSASNPAGLKLTRKSQGLPDRLQMEFLRLSLPITCRSSYIRLEISIPPSINQPIKLHSNN